MEDHLPQGCNLLNNFEFKGGGPRTATHPKSVEEVVVGDGGGEAAIENHRHRLTNHLREAYTAVVPSPFRYQDHHMTGRFLCDDPVLER